MAGSDVTRILSAAAAGDPHAAGQLLPLVYDELRKLAARRMADEQAGQTLQATALVHEAYLRLVDVGEAQQQQQQQQQHWNGRGHFFAAAAEAMRRILVENARRKHRLKAGGGRRRVDLDGVDPAAVAGPAGEDMLALDEALGMLERDDRRKAELVKLRFFAGLTNDQAAAVLGISGATAENDWAYARAWLRLQLGGTPSGGRAGGG
jgi:RNA polymerase sigma factor (TIGR02999 family)